MKILIYLIFIILYLLVTFFGLGPVMLADGSDTERTITLAVVMAVYIVITVVFTYIIKRINNSTKR